MKKIVLSISTLAMLSSTAQADWLVGLDYTAVSSMTETNTFAETQNLQIFLINQLHLK